MHAGLGPPTPAQWTGGGLTHGGLRTSRWAALRPIATRDGGNLRPVSGDNQRMPADLMRTHGVHREFMFMMQLAVYTVLRESRKIPGLARRHERCSC